MEVSFWTMVNALPLHVVAPFESTREEGDQLCQTLLGVHRECEGVFINML